jgi:dTDP-4-amino-4,6-dideoxygalactose transaminase
MKKIQKPIYVTQPFLPPLKEFIPFLKDIWNSKWLTNMGRYHRQFEKELADYLGVKYVSLFVNGTLALITALQVLRITGEVITTPFSFVATAHALYWNGITPVFCDIEPEYCNIDPDKIEALITPKTTAILPVHVYGNPCQVDKIERIADTYGLKVIYDACHAFGVKINGKSILNYGDLSVLSFHATKVFTTFEGGAIICHDEKTKKRIDFLKNFGFADEITVVGQGINAKMNEFSAALGLLQLKYIDKVIARRKKITELYRKKLTGIKGIRFLKEIAGIKHNFAYFPIFIDKKEYGKTRDELYEELKKHNLFVRRYFYPLISHFSIYRGLTSATPDKLRVAERIAKEVLCLPIYDKLKLENISYITNIIRNYKHAI